MILFILGLNHNWVVVPHGETFNVRINLKKLNAFSLIFFSITTQIKPLFVLLKKKTAKNGKEASLFKVYLKVYGRRLFGAAVLKLIGEMFFFINPLAVGALTAYVTTLRYPSAESKVCDWDFTWGVVKTSQKWRICCTHHLNPPFKTHGSAPDVDNHAVLPQYTRLDCSARRIRMVISHRLVHGICTVEVCEAQTLKLWTVCRKFKSEMDPLNLFPFKQIWMHCTICNNTIK